MFYINDIHNIQENVFIMTAINKISFDQFKIHYDKYPHDTQIKRAIYDLVVNCKNNIELVPNQETIDFIKANDFQYKFKNIKVMKKPNNKSEHNFIKYIDFDNVKFDPKLLEFHIESDPSWKKDTIVTINTGIGFYLPKYKTVVIEGVNVKSALILFDGSDNGCQHLSIFITEDMPKVMIFKLYVELNLKQNDALSLTSTSVNIKASVMNNKSALVYNLKNLPQCDADRISVNKTNTHIGVYGRKRFNAQGIWCVPGYFVKGVDKTFNKPITQNNKSEKDVFCFNYIFNAVNVEFTELADDAKLPCTKGSLALNGHYFAMMDNYSEISKAIRKNCTFQNKLKTIDSYLNNSQRIIDCNNDRKTYEKLILLVCMFPDLLRKPEDIARYIAMDLPLTFNDLGAFIGHLRKTATDKIKDQPLQNKLITYVNNIYKSLRITNHVDLPLNTESDILNLYDCIPSCNKRKRDDDDDNDEHVEKLVKN